MSMNDDDTRGVPLAAMVIASLFAALVIVGAYISIPIPGSPVPVVAQNLFVLLAGMVLGWRWGAVSIAVYLILGILGLPVFSGGRGGLGHFLGPTGGYLVGFLFAAALSGLIAQGFHGPAWLTGAQGRNRKVARNRSILRDGIAASAGSLAVYAIGLPWLKAATGMGWAAAFSAGVLPFIIGDILKAAAAVAAVRLIEPVLRSALAGRYGRIQSENEPG